MNLSFYSSAVNAAAQQRKLDVIANNFANASTYGYKTKSAVFSDLLYQGMRAQTEATSKVKNGSGARVDSINTSYSQGTIQATDNPFDFAIEGDGFFALQNPATGQVSYSRAGGFQISESINGRFFLIAPTGEMVLSKTRQPIEVFSPQQDFSNIAVFDFRSKEGLQSVGANMFVPTEKNGPALLVDNKNAMQGKIEWTNMEMSSEFTKLIEAQRTYSLNLKMLTTSDEVAQNIQGLR